MSPLLALLAVLSTPDTSHDRAALTEGVADMVAPGALPGNMVSLGNSFVVLTGQTDGRRAPLFVASYVGAGRVLAGGHESFFGKQSLKNPNNARFYANSIRWLAHRSAAKVGYLEMGVDEATSTAGFTPVPLHREDLSSGLGSIDALVITPGELDNNPTAQSRVLEFVKSGHGLLIAGPGWGWASLHPHLNFQTKHPGNSLLRPYGIAFGGETMDGPYNSSRAETLNANHALDLLGSGQGSADEKADAVAMVEQAIATIPLLGATSFEKDLLSKVTKLAQQESHGVGPTPANKITSAMPLARLKVSLDDRTIKGSAEPKAYPTASDFPGDVSPDTPLVSRTLAIDASVPQWHSTGLYAKAGTAIEVEIPAELVPQGYGIRIGSHTDTLWRVDSWSRFPDVSKYVRLTSPVTRVTSAFGGLIYFEVPEAKVPNVKVTIRNAVPAVHFVRGKTTSTEWQQMKNAPAPWADLEGKFVSITVPAKVVRNLQDPEALMAYWDQMMGLCYAFYSAPVRSRPERYCTDVQISLGYMHSGYPIMTFLDVAPRFVDLATLRSHTGLTWGFYHEMGHNFQQSAWTWDGCGEVTNNLFSLYASEKLNGADYHDYGKAHEAVSREAMHDRLAKYLADGAPYDTWKSEPFLALTMYIELRDAFGWEPFTRLFATYRDLPRSEQPKTDEEKRDQWMVRFSHAIGKNLGPFFQAWGVPTSEAARASIANLPKWMPADWPGK